MEFKTHSWFAQLTSSPFLYLDILIMLLTICPLYIAKAHLVILPCRHSVSGSPSFILLKCWLYGRLHFYCCIQKLWMRMHQKLKKSILWIHAVFSPKTCAVLSIINGFSFIHPAICTFKAYALKALPDKHLRAYWLKQQIKTSSGRLKVILHMGEEVSTEGRLKGTVCFKCLCWLLLKPYITAKQHMR